MQPTRRDVMAMALLLGPARGFAASGKPSMSFPSAPRDRLAVATYPFRAFIDTPRNRAKNPQAQLMDLKQFAATIPEKFNVHNMEVLGEHIHARDAVSLAELRAACKTAGVQIVNIPTGVGASVYDPDAARRALAVENGKKWVDTATALGCPSVRLHVQRTQGSSPDVQRAAETLGTIAQYGAENNVVVNLENDDPVTEEAFFIVKVIDQANSPWLRALPDFCNSMLKADAKFNYEAMTALFPRAYNISHVKDTEVEGDKVFTVDLERTFQIAIAAGYRGYFSMEFEGAGDPYDGTRKLIEQSVRILASAKPRP